MLRTVRPDDAPSIAEIYNHYILNSPATFEEVPVSPDEMRMRILDTTQAYPWLVSEEDGKLLGDRYGSTSPKSNLDSGIKTRGAVAKSMVEVGVGILKSWAKSDVLKEIRRR